MENSAMKRLTAIRLLLAIMAFALLSKVSFSAPKITKDPYSITYNYCYDTNYFACQPEPPPY